MISKNDFVGCWVSSLPFDSADYLVEYEITLTEGMFSVRARDLQDGEEIEISDVGYHNKTLKFMSYVPSTKRKGVNRFRLTNKNRIDSEFTFTVLEKLKRRKKSDRGRTAGSA
jgi:hypothetical protein